MKKTLLCSVLVVLAICAVPSSAAALQCPAAPAPEDNIYIVNGDPNNVDADLTDGGTTVLDCTYGTGNLNGNPANDDFLTGGDTFGAGTWTSFCSTTADGGNTCDDAPLNFAFTSTTWSFTGVLGTEYALGIKDGEGGAADWAVFLLASSDPTNPVLYSGTWQIIKNGANNPGALSHFAIYDRVTGGGFGQTPVPEPASLLLLGSGLATIAHRIRKRKAPKA